MGILQAKNMLSLIAIAYTGIAIASAFTEFSNITKATSNINSTVSLAADMALSQVVASDEFFNNQEPSATMGSIYDTKGVTTVKTYDFSGGIMTPTDENIFDLVYGNSAGDLNSDSGKKKLYKAMYGSTKSDFANENYLKMAMQLTSTVNDKTIPRIARMGLLDNTVGGGSTGIFEAANSYSLVYDTLNSQLSFHNGYDPEFKKYDTKTDWLGLFECAKQIDSQHKNRGTYFLAPTNVGVTYIDRKLLQTAFVSNMDLIMRSEIPADGYTITADDKTIAGVGIPSSNVDGTAFVVTQEAQANLIHNNVINDGTFAFVKGTLNKGNGGWSGMAGNATITPTVEYKLIDMCNIKNEDIVRLALGVPKGESGGANYSGYLTSIGVNPGEYTPIIVAKITFYADVIVPYSSWIGREYYSMIERQGSADTNFLFQVPTEVDSATADPNLKYSTLTGNRLYEYTTYYAVAP